MTCPSGDGPVNKMGWGTLAGPDPAAFEGGMPVALGEADGEIELPVAVDTAAVATPGLREIVDALAMMELACEGEMVVVLGGTELLPALAPELVPLMDLPATGLTDCERSSDCVSMKAMVGPATMESGAC